MSSPAARSRPSAARDHGPAAARRDFERQVRDALACLYDPVSLQTHPLAERVRAARPNDSLGIGKALQACLLEAIEALRPQAGASADQLRAHEILVRRYVDGLTAPAVQAASAVA